MLSIIKYIFWPPVFDDEDKNRAAQYLNVILWVSGILLTGLRIFTFSTEFGSNFVEYITNPITILAGMLFMLIIVMRIGYVQQASFLMLISAWAALTAQARSSTGIYDTAFLANFVIIVMSGLLLGPRASFFFSMLAIGTGWWLASIQTAQNITPAIDIPYNLARDNTLIIILIALISYLSINGLRTALKNASRNAADLAKSNKSLQSLSRDLEKRVEERTYELEKRSFELEEISQKSQRRADRLQAVAQVGRAITSIQSLQSLLPRVAGVIGRQFALYHVGIFLLDDAREFAILSAASSAGGQNMLNRGHRLRVGVEGVVGSAATSGSPKIAEDTGESGAFKFNPDLPDTRSEVAIPLKIRNETLGVLDLQSDQPQAFSEEDIELLTIVADQVAIAIQNSRRFQETQKASLEAETLYGDSVRKQWVAYTRDQDSLGFQYSGTSSIPLRDKVANTATRQAIETKTPASQVDGSGSKLAIPIRLRGQVIGLLHIAYPGSRQWNQDDVDITNAVAERLSLAIENARLLQDAQTRANRERVIGEISARLSATNDMEVIFQTAARELGQVIPDAEVVVQFLPDRSTEKEL